MIEKESYEENNDNKINCHIIDLLLNKDYEVTKKIATIANGNYYCSSLLDDYFYNKGMASIQIDSTNQSVCFTSQKFLVPIYNQASRKNEEYHEEIHIHINDLNEYDNFKEYLYRSEYSDIIAEVDKVPHYDSIYKDKLQDYELVIAPMTDEVSATKNLVNILAQRSDETIFRALTIHFCNLIDKTSDIDIDLVRRLNNIYQEDVVDNEGLFFSDEVANKLENFYVSEKDYSRNMVKIPSENIKLQNKNYSIDINEAEKTNKEL